MISTEKAILAKRIEATSEFLSIVTDAGEYRIPWNACSAKLARATGEERAKLKLSPSGYGIHWPLIDEDLTVKGLVGKHLER